MQAVSVFCGSSSGKGEDYLSAAIRLGELLAKREITLVYGGASIGVMGALADSVLANGGKVIGVIPENLMIKEVVHGGLADLRVVSSMHERKALMEKLSDGFIALPGGFGTLDEFCEVITWAQLGLHQKPCGVLNVRGYYDPFFQFVNQGVSERFVRKEHLSMIIVSNEPSDLIDRMISYRPVEVKKWIRGMDDA
jgi:uncharacterized protein (TIGR00730 family)